MMGEAGGTAARRIFDSHPTSVWLSGRPEGQTDVLDNLQKEFEGVAASTGEAAQDGRVVPITSPARALRDSLEDTEDAVSDIMWKRHYDEEADNLEHNDWPRSRLRSSSCKYLSAQKRATPVLHEDLLPHSPECFGRLQQEQQQCTAYRKRPYSAGCVPGGLSGDIGPVVLGDSMYGDLIFDSTEQGGQSSCHLHAVDCWRPKSCCPPCSSSPSRNNRDVYSICTAEKCRNKETEENGCSNPLADDVNEVFCSSLSQRFTGDNEAHACGVQLSGSGSHHRSRSCTSHPNNAMNKHLQPALTYVDAYAPACCRTISPRTAPPMAQQSACTSHYRLLQNSKHSPLRYKRCCSGTDGGTGNSICAAAAAVVAAARAQCAAEAALEAQKEAEALAAHANRQEGGAVSEENGRPGGESSQYACPRGLHQQNRLYSKVVQPNCVGQSRACISGDKRSRPPVHLGVLETDVPEGGRGCGPGSFTDNQCISRVEAPSSEQLAHAPHFSPAFLTCSSSVGDVGDGNGAATRTRSNRVVEPTQSSTIASGDVVTADNRSAPGPQGGYLGAPCKLLWGPISQDVMRGPASVPGTSLDRSSSPSATTSPLSSSPLTKASPRLWVDTFAAAAAAATALSPTSCLTTGCVKASRSTGCPPSWRRIQQNTIAHRAAAAEAAAIQRQRRVSSRKKSSWKSSSQTVKAGSSAYMPGPMYDDSRRLSPRQRLQYMKSRGSQSTSSLAIATLHTKQQQMQRADCSPACRTVAAAAQRISLKKKREAGVISQAALNISRQKPQDATRRSPTATAIAQAISGVAAPVERALETVEIFEALGLDKDGRPKEGFDRVRAPLLAGRAAPTPATESNGKSQSTNRMTSADLQRLMRVKNASGSKAPPMHDTKSKSTNVSSSCTHFSTGSLSNTVSCCKPSTSVHAHRCISTAAAETCVASLDSRRCNVSAAAGNVVRCGHNDIDFASEDYYPCQLAGAAAGSARRCQSAGTARGPTRTSAVATAAAAAAAVLAAANALVQSASSAAVAAADSLVGERDRQELSRHSDAAFHCSRLSERESLESAAEAAAASLRAARKAAATAAAALETLQQQVAEEARKDRMAQEDLCCEGCFSRVEGADASSCEVVSEEHCCATLAAHNVHERASASLRASLTTQQQCKGAGEEEDKGGNKERGKKHSDSTRKSRSVGDLSQVVQEEGAVSTKTGKKHKSRASDAQPTKGEDEVEVANSHRVSEKRKHSKHAKGADEGRLASEVHLRRKHTKGKKSSHRDEEGYEECSSTVVSRDSSFSKNGSHYSIENRASKHASRSLDADNSQMAEEGSSVAVASVGKNEAMEVSGEKQKIQKGPSNEKLNHKEKTWQGQSFSAPERRGENFQWKTGKKLTAESAKDVGRTSGEAEKKDDDADMADRGRATTDLVSEGEKAVEEEMSREKSEKHKKKRESQSKKSHPAQSFASSFEGDEAQQRNGEENPATEKTPKPKCSSSALREHKSNKKKHSTSSSKSCSRKNTTISKEEEDIEGKDAQGIAAEAEKAKGKKKKKSTASVEEPEYKPQGSKGAEDSQINACKQPVLPAAPYQGVCAHMRYLHVQPPHSAVRSSLFSRLSTTASFEVSVPLPDTSVKERGAATGLINGGAGRTGTPPQQQKQLLSQQKSENAVLQELSHYQHSQHVRLQSRQPQQPENGLQGRHGNSPGQPALLKKHAIQTPEGSSPLPKSEQLLRVRCLQQAPKLSLSQPHQLRALSLQPSDVHGEACLQRLPSLPLPSARSHTLMRLSKPGGTEKKLKRMQPWQRMLHWQQVWRRQKRFTQRYQRQQEGRGRQQLIARRQFQQSNSHQFIHRAYLVSQERQVEPQECNQDYIGTLASEGSNHISCSPVEEFNKPLSRGTGRTGASQSKNPQCGQHHVQRTPSPGQERQQASVPQTDETKLVQNPQQPEITRLSFLGVQQQQNMSCRGLPCPEQMCSSVQEHHYTPKSLQQEGVSVPTSPKISDVCSSESGKGVPDLVGDLASSDTGGSKILQAEDERVVSRHPEKSISSKTSKEEKKQGAKDGAAVSSREDCMCTEKQSGCAQVGLTRGEKPNSSPRGHTGPAKDVSENSDVERTTGKQDGVTPSEIVQKHSPSPPAVLMPTTGSSVGATADPVKGSPLISTAQWRLQVSGEAANENDTRRNVEARPAYCDWSERSARVHPELSGHAEQMKTHEQQDGTPDAPEETFESTEQLHHNTQDLHLSREMHRQYAASVGSNSDTFAFFPDVGTGHVSSGTSNCRFPLAVRMKAASAIAARLRHFGSPWASLTDNTAAATAAPAAAEVLAGNLRGGRHSLFGFPVRVLETPPNSEGHNSHDNDRRAHLGGSVTEAGESDRRAEDETVTACHGARRDRQRSERSVRSNSRVRCPSYSPRTGAFKPPQMGERRSASYGSRRSAKGKLRSREVHSVPHHSSGCRYRRHCTASRRRHSKAKTTEEVAASNSVDFRKHHEKLPHTAQHVRECGARRHSRRKSRQRHHGSCRHARCRRCSQVKNGRRRKCCCSRNHAARNRQHRFYRDLIYLLRLASRGEKPTREVACDVPQDVTNPSVYSPLRQQSNTQRDTPPGRAEVEALIAAAFAKTSAPVNKEACVSSGSGNPITAEQLWKILALSSDRQKEVRINDKEQVALAAGETVHLTNTSKRIASTYPKKRATRSIIRTSCVSCWPIMAFCASYPLPSCFDVVTVSATVCSTTGDAGLRNDAKTVHNKESVGSGNGSTIRPVYSEAALLMLNRFAESQQFSGRQGLENEVTQLHEGAEKAANTLQRTGLSGSLFDATDAQQAMPVNEDQKNSALQVETREHVSIQQLEPQQISLQQQDVGKKCGQSQEDKQTREAPDQGDQKSLERCEEGETSVNESQEKGKCLDESSATALRRDCLQDTATSSDASETAYQSAITQRMVSCETTTSHKEQSCGTKSGQPLEPAEQQLASEDRSRSRQTPASLVELEDEPLDEYVNSGATVQVPCEVAQQKGEQGELEPEGKLECGSQELQTDLFEVGRRTPPPSESEKDGCSSCTKGHSSAPADVVKISLDGNGHQDSRLPQQQQQEPLRPTRHGRPDGQAERQQFEKHLLPAGQERQQQKSEFHEPMHAQEGRQVNGEEDKVEESGQDAGESSSNPTWEALDVDVPDPAFDRLQREILDYRRRFTERLLQREPVLRVKLQDHCNHQRENNSVELHTGMRNDGLACLRHGVKAAKDESHGESRVSSSQHTLVQQCGQKEIGDHNEEGSSGEVEDNETSHKHNAQQLHALLQAYGSWAVSASVAEDFLQEAFDEAVEQVEDSLATAVEDFLEQEQRQLVAIGNEKNNAAAALATRC